MWLDVRFMVRNSNGSESQGSETPLNMRMKCWYVCDLVVSHCWCDCGGIAVACCVSHQCQAGTSVSICSRLLQCSSKSSTLCVQECLCVAGPCTDQGSCMQHPTRRVSVSAKDLKVVTSTQQRHQSCDWIRAAVSGSQPSAPQLIRVKTHTRKQLLRRFEQSEMMVMRVMRVLCVGCGSHLRACPPGPCRMR